MTPEFAIYKCTHCFNIWQQVSLIIVDNTVVRANVECDKCGSFYMEWLNYADFIRRAC